MHGKTKIYSVYICPVHFYKQTQCHFCSHTCILNSASRFFYYYLLLSVLRMIFIGKRAFDYTKSVERGYRFLEACSRCTFSSKQGTNCINFPRIVKLLHCKQLNINAFVRSTGRAGNQSLPWSRSLCRRLIYFTDGDGIHINNPILNLMSNQPLPFLLSYFCI